MSLAQFTDACTQIGYAIVMLGGGITAGIIAPILLNYRNL